MDTTEAYRICEEITWSQARNFAYGIRLLPAGKRQSLAALYAFARRIDDIGDGEMAAPDKLAALETARHGVLSLVGPDAPAPRADDPVLVALADTGRRFPVPMVAFGELIDGCVADTKGVTYTSFDDLRYYCRCVAGSIGRLSLGIFGTTGDAAEAERLADSLGVALQITNILRDIREDYQNGRVYLPAEDLDRFGVTLKPAGEPDPAAEPSPDAAAEARFVTLIEFEAARARDWYTTGLQLLPLLDARSAACTGAMAGIYRRLLDRIAANPHAVLEGRMSLPGSEKALVAAEALAGFDRWKYRRGAAK